jgi:hypothetical protein
VDDYRFWIKARPSETGCWLWTGVTNGRYGNVTRDGKRLLAHRHAYERAFGPIPDGAVVMHACDTPLCVRPAHLSLGTQADNLADARGKRRLRLDGTYNPAAKLTPEQVIAIRADTRTQRVIAAEYGCSQPLVAAIKARKVWAHL